MATVPSEMTAAAGAILTAAEWNSNVRDAINFLIGPPTCACRQTVAQSIPNSATTAVTLDTEDFDNDGMHSTVTNTSRITAQTAGRYQLGGGVGFSGNSTGIRSAQWMLNGSLMAAGTAQMSAASTVVTDAPARTISTFMNVGDYVEIGAQQTSGGALNTAVSTADQSGVIVRWIATT